MQEGLGLGITSCGRNSPVELRDVRCCAGEFLECGNNIAEADLVRTDYHAIVGFDSLARFAWMWDFGPFWFQRYRLPLCDFPIHYHFAQMLDHIARFSESICHSVRDEAWLQSLDMHDKWVLSLVLAQPPIGVDSAVYRRH